MRIVPARRPALRFALVVALLALAAPRGARAANDLGLSVGPVERLGEAICVSYRVERPFTPRLAETLLGGMPATVTFEVGVWKRRALWFDKLVLALKSEHRIAYDSWTRSFRIRSGSNPPRTRAVPDLDSLQTLLFEERKLPLLAASALDSAAGHYVSVKVLIRPLDPEDLAELEDWLMGEEHPAEGGPRGVPRYLLNLAVGLSGLGDRSALVKSARFVPARLRPAPRFPPSP